MKKNELGLTHVSFEIVITKASKFIEYDSLKLNNNIRLFYVDA